MCSVIDSSLIEAVVNDCRHHCTVKIITLFNLLIYICHKLFINHHRRKSLL